jgi:hypothetical protein
LGEFFPSSTSSSRIAGNVMVAFSLNLITANYLKHGSPLALLLTNLIKVGQLIHLQIVLMEIYPLVN